MGLIAVVYILLVDEIIIVCQVWRFYFQPFWFYRADRQTDRQTESHTDRITEADGINAIGPTHTIHTYIHTYIYCLIK